MELFRRTELQTYTRVCERLLSSVIQPELTQEEQDLILYYVNELARKFERRGQNRFSDLDPPLLPLPYSSPWTST